MFVGDGSRSKKAGITRQKGKSAGPGTKLVHIQVLVQAWKALSKGV